MPPFMHEGEHIAKIITKNIIFYKKLYALCKDLRVWQTVPVYPVAQVQAFGAKYQRMNQRMSFNIR